MTIRPAALTDAPALAEIYKYYVNQTAVTFEIVPPGPEELRGRMERTMARYPWLVAQEGERVAGYAYAGPFYGRAAYDWSCELTVYLDRERRGRGLGRELYGALIRELTGMGVRNLYACVAWTDREDGTLTNASARFHESMGFRRVGTFRKCGYKFDRWYDMIWMEKMVGDHPVPVPPIQSWRR